MNTDPRRTKLKEYRKGTGQSRRRRSFWKRYDPWERPTPKDIADSERAERKHGPLSDEPIEPYSETDFVIEAGPNGSASCYIKTQGD